MTNAEQLDNCYTLLNFWDSVLPEMVSPMLNVWIHTHDTYPCGAVACLGGHAVTSGLFPSANFENVEYLFGDILLFDCRNFDEGNVDSDWEVARKRIVRAIERLEGMV
jgi:hypothetical protein